MGELWGGTVPARKCQTGGKLERENCELYRNEPKERNEPSKSSRKGDRDDPGSLFLNSNIPKNPHRGPSEEILKSKKPNKVSKFWEKNDDLKSDIKPICVGPMGGRGYCADSVTSLSETSSKRK